MKFLDRDEKDELLECYGVLTSFLPKEYIDNYCSTFISTDHQIIGRNLDLLQQGNDIEEIPLKESMNNLKCFIRTTEGSLNNYLEQIIDNLMKLYKIITIRMIEITNQGNSFQSVSILHDILEIVITYIKTTSPNQCKRFIECYNQLLIEEYSRCSVSQRHCNTVWLYYHLVDKLHSEVTPELSKFYYQIITLSLEVIKGNMTLYPEMRIALFSFVHLTIQHCGQTILRVSPNDFYFLLDFINWGNEHIDRNVYSKSLECLQSLLVQCFVNNDIILIGLFMERMGNIVKTLVKINIDLNHTRDFDDIV